MGNIIYRKPVPPAYLGLRNFYMVETVIPASAAVPNNATRINIIDQPFLRDKLIVSLEMYSATDIAFSPSQQPVAPIANLLNASLTLYSDTPDEPGNMGEWYQNIPFCDLHMIQNATPDPFVRNRFTLGGPLVSWDKCYYTLGAALGIVAPVSFLLSVGYIFQEKD